MKVILRSHIFVAVNSWAFSHFIVYMHLQSTRNYKRLEVATRNIVLFFVFCMRSSRVDSSTPLSRYSKREGMSLPLTEPYVRFSRIRLFRKSLVSSSKYPLSGVALECNNSKFAETSDISVFPFGHGDSAFGRWSISDISRSAV